MLEPIGIVHIIALIFPIISESQRDRMIYSIK